MEYDDFISEDFKLKEEDWSIKWKINRKSHYTCLEVIPIVEELKEKILKDLEKHGHYDEGLKNILTKRFGF